MTALLIIARFLKILLTPIVIVPNPVLVKCVLISFKNGVMFFLVIAEEGDQQHGIVVRFAKNRKIHRGTYAKRKSVFKRSDSKVKKAVFGGGALVKLQQGNCVQVRRHSHVIFFGELRAYEVCNNFLFQKRGKERRG